MYIYENFAIKERKESYVVYSLENEEADKVRVLKKDLEALEGVEESEMLAVLFYVIESNRIDNSTGLYSARRFWKNEEFLIRLENILSRKSIEYVITEISGLKYHEMEDYFFAENESEFDEE